MEKNGITQGVIWKQLLIFFAPIFLGTLCQQLYNFADAVIVGRFVGKAALSAINSTGTLTNLCINFFTGLSTGAAVMIAQQWGAKNEKNISKSVHTGMCLAGLAGLTVSVLGVILTPQIANSCGCARNTVRAVLRKVSQPS
ncbi:MAG: hypothetical protein GXY49_03865 [Syntrophomonadaceae bacterium]|nr:hypothetical protein [Syntrophomonadaceae bacterium]